MRKDSTLNGKIMSDYPLKIVRQKPYSINIYTLIYCYLLIVQENKSTAFIKGFRD